MLQNLDPSDVKVYSLYVAYAAIWAKLVFEVLNAEASTSLYAFGAWAATTLTTLSLSAWVTLAVIQVALRFGNYKMYGLPAFRAIQSQICILCYYTCERILKPGMETNTLLNAFFQGPTVETPQHMDELAGMLYELSNSISPGHGGSLTSMDSDEIKNFCKLLDMWWNITMPILNTAEANARRSETVSAIYNYKHNMVLLQGEIKNILEEIGTNGELIDHTRNLRARSRNITNLNSGFYTRLLAETQSQE